MSTYVVYNRHCLTLYFFDGLNYTGCYKKRALQLWKSIQIYTEDIHNVLNCHNVAKHCKLDACGNVVLNTATASAPAVEIKMATFTGAVCARCVFWFEDTKPATQVQRKFRIQYRKEPPSRPAIYSWHKNFVETGCSVRHAKSFGCPCVSDAIVEQLREGLVQSPWKSMRRASWETSTPNVLYGSVTKHLHLKAYKLSIVQHLTDADKVVRREFCMQMFHRIQDERFRIRWNICIQNSLRTTLSASMDFQRWKHVSC
jgi:hypothetical protein